MVNLKPITSITSAPIVLKVFEKKEFIVSEASICVDKIQIIILDES